MFSRLKHRLTNTGEKKRLLSNISALTVLQGANYILPLLTVPYLVRVLGPEYFGLLAFASATIGYCHLISDYGFGLSATRQISIHRDNPEQVNQIFNAVMMIKVGLMLVSFVLMSLLVFSFTKFSQNWEVYFITFGMVIGQVLFPWWLFQGMERMKYIAVINIGVRAFFTVGIFIFVQEQADYLRVPLLTSLGTIFAGVWSLYLVKKEFNITFSWRAPILTPKIIKTQLYDGWHVFISGVAINIYTVSTTFILGIFANNTVVGYFAAADKLVGVAKGLCGPILQAIYPLTSRKIHQNKEAGIVFIKKVALIIGSVMLAVSLLLFLFAEPVVYWLLGEQYRESVLLIKIMSFLPFLTTISAILGVQIMLNLGYKRAFSYILFVSACISVGLGLIVVPIYGALGSASTLLVVEIFVTITMFVFLWIKLRK